VIVLVHGVPETAAIWAKVRAQVDRESVALTLPGFGCPLPDGFGGSKDDYADWLVGELEAYDEPVDLVGHDWGGGFVLRLACTRPELIRTWVSDVAGLLDPDYVWHDFAQLWQTPVAGEQWVTDTVAAPDSDTVDLLVAVGVTPDAAAEFARAMDEEMGRCILALYRSAAQPALREWGADAEAAAARPGLVVVGGDDPFTGGSEFSRRSAVRLGARFQELDGLGHFWPLQDPVRGARVLEEFWASAP